MWLVGYGLLGSLSECSCSVLFDLNCFHHPSCQQRAGLSVVVYGFNSAGKVMMIVRREGVEVLRRALWLEGRRSRGEREVEDDFEEEKVMVDLSWKMCFADQSGLLVLIRFPLG